MCTETYCTVILYCPYFRVHPVLYCQYIINPILYCTDCDAILVDI
jgi:hypothetical protein